MKKITVGWLEIGQGERDAVNQILDSGRISEGPKTFEFEKKWAEFIGTKYCVAVSSGTAALITALTALKNIYNLEKRPKLITSPLTYISDANAAVLSGFEPVFADIDARTFCILPDEVERILKQSDNPGLFSIILPVDLMGYSVELEKIKNIAKKYGLLVLEDAAEAHGTVYKGKKCGSGADAGIFSFYIAHNIQAGEMGAINTNNYDIYRIAKKLKANGRVCECRVCTRSKGMCPAIQASQGKSGFDPRFLHDIIGYNFKTMEFQPAIALAQLEKINHILERRRDNVKLLNDGLSEYSDLLQLPVYNEEVSYLAYPLVLKKNGYFSVWDLRQELEKKGIETRPLFGCIPTQQPAYAYLKPQYSGKLPNAEFIGQNGFYIGCHQYIGKDDIDYIISVFKRLFVRAAG